jgi:hypothetical protein
MKYFGGSYDSSVAFLEKLFNENTPVIEDQRYIRAIPNDVILNKFSDIKFLYNNISR